MTRVACLLAAVVVTGGCRKTLERPDVGDPMTFDVQLISGQTGSEAAPLPFAATMSFELSISAIGYDGEALPWDGEVHLRVNPVGSLAASSPEWIPIVGGRADAVTIDVEGIHGKANIWVEHTGTDDEPGSYATGLSPAIVVSHPTVRQMQETDNHRTNRLEGDFVQIELEGRDAIVTAVTNDGFYVTDKTDLAWGGLFVFTHSRPGDLEDGDRIVQLAGTADEFYGFTELSFPSFKKEGKSDPLDPVELTPEVVVDNLAMEQFEGGLVRVRDVTVCPTTEDFVTFGQWRVLVDPAGDCDSGEGAVVIVSAFTVDWFDPTEHAGQGLAQVTGNLRYHTSAGWIVRPRNNDDMTL